MEDISVFGLGYVGCVTGACFARSGLNVTGVDINSDKVDMINDGQSPIVEPGLDKLLKEVTASGRFRATTSCQEAIDASSIALICVGTPGNEHGELSVDALTRVATEIGQAARHRSEPLAVVVRSTVLPGTTERIVKSAISEAMGDSAATVTVAMNPEFIREGSAIDDFFHPPFTLIGSRDRSTASRIESIYSEVAGEIIHSDIPTAESVKYACNAFHALKICFANEIADTCDALGADAQEVMRIFAKDEKLNISSAYLKPGFAFGGSCLPKDLRALLYAIRHNDVDAPLLDSILPSNDRQVQHAVDRVMAMGKRRVGVVGLSFKAGTDDLRESPMVTLIEALIGKGCDVKVLDKNVALAKLMGANRAYIEEEIPHISMLMCDAAETLVQHSDILVIGAASDEAIDVIRQSRDDQLIVDLTRGLIERKIETVRKVA